MTLAGRGEAETRVRGSRFLAVAAPADTDEAARAHLASLQRARFDASHHCSAWRLRDGVWRSNDAGEPSGSAGAPILAAIDAAGLADTVVVVTRYFGGTRLGVGGLVRAYGEAATLALSAAPRRHGIPARRIVIRYPYAHTAAVIRALEAAQAAEINHGYDTALGGGETNAVVPRGGVDEIGVRLREQTAGEVRPELLGECILFHPAALPLALSRLDARRGSL